MGPFVDEEDAECSFSALGQAKPVPEHLCLSPQSLIEIDYPSIPSHYDKIHNLILLMRSVFMHMIRHTGDHNPVLILELTAQDVRRVRMQRVAKTIVRDKFGNHDRDRFARLALPGEITDICQDGFNEETIR